MVRSGHSIKGANSFDLVFDDASGEIGQSHSCDQYEEIDDLPFTTQQHCSDGNSQECHEQERRGGKSGHDQIKEAATQLLIDQHKEFKIESRGLEQ